MLRRLILSTLDRPHIVRALSVIRRSKYAIFMLHRFRERAPEAADHARTGGHDPEALGHLLRSLRAAGVRMLSVDELVAGLVGQSPLPPGPAVAFTVDDCYVDLAEVGFPVFQANDCQVTGFVVTDAVDGACWLWWDQVHYILRRASRGPLTVELAGSPVTFMLADVPSRVVVGRTIIERLKSVPAGALYGAISALSAAADVPVPAAPPPAFAVLSWARLREMEATGLARFGAHTLTHPILARCDDARAVREIEQSVARVRAELLAPSQVFAYPVGRDGDFGAREEAIVAGAGLLGAVTAEPGRPSRCQARGGRWRLPRFAHDERRGAAAALLLL